MSGRRLVNLLPWLGALGRAPETRELRPAIASVVQAIHGGCQGLVALCFCRARVNGPLTGEKDLPALISLQLTMVQSALAPEAVSSAG